jgi:hypothetical protein
MSRRAFGNRRPRSLRRVTSVCVAFGVCGNGDFFAAAHWNVYRGCDGVETFSSSVTSVAPSLSNVSLALTGNQRDRFAKFLAKLGPSLHDFAKRIVILD